MHKLVPIVVDAMGGAFPELKKNVEHVVEIVKDEEVSFGKTLDRGIKLFNESLEQAVAKLPFKAEYKARSAKIRLMPTESGETMLGIVDEQKNIIANGKPVSDITSEWISKYFSTLPTFDGQTAFTLHDTYDFPIDLTRIMAEERGMTVDIAGYEKLMEQAKELARSGLHQTDEGKVETQPTSRCPLSSHNWPTSALKP